MSRARGNPLLEEPLGSRRGCIRKLAVRRRPNRIDAVTGANEQRGGCQGYERHQQGVFNQVLTLFVGEELRRDFLHGQDRMLNLRRSERLSGVNGGPGTAQGRTPSTAYALCIQWAGQRFQTESFHRGPDSKRIG